MTLTATATTTSFTAAALEIASALQASSVEVPGGLAWHGPVPLPTGGDVLETAIGDTGRDLYSGSAGIGLFLAAAGAVGGEPRLAATARAALEASLLWASQSLTTGPLGLLDGAAGIAWAWAEAGRLLEDPDLTAAGTELATRAGEASLDRGAAAFDVTVGDAGLILALLAISPRSAVPPTVAALAERLAAGGRPAPWGRAWPDPADLPEQPALLGMAHGAAGIALALREAADALDRADLHAAAADAIRYERSHYSPTRVNWPDLREAGRGRGPWPGWPVYWCHGALGIGLARLREFELTRDDWALAEVGAALQAARQLVIASGTGLRSGVPAGDACVCHGLAGVAALMLEAGEVLGGPEHVAGARRTGQLMLETRAASGAWPCGLQGAGEVPGLFLGVAGIGLTLLRLAHPEAIANVALPGPGGRARQDSLPAESLSAESLSAESLSAESLSRANRSVSGSA
jgi:lantibiotic modifying enzyme